MNLSDLLKAMGRAFFVIATGTLLSMYLFCLILTPNATFSLDDLGRVLLMAVVGDLPYVVFYSKKELTKRQMIVRFAIHIPILISILIYFASLWDWVDITKPIEIVVLVLLILLVYVGVITLASFQDKKTAARLNDSLRRNFHN